MSGFASRFGRHGCARRNRLSVRAGLLATAVLLPAPLLAQDTDEGEDGDEIVVIGELNRSIESSLAAKRELDVIADAIIGDEIGDLPDLSVAETLARIVGVTSDRFRGGASELSIRGLGPFLSASFLNGREISSGSDGRDVNFGQFPSELVSGVIVYKSQQASFIEGGIAGLIELQTVRPLEVNGRRIQVQVLGGYSDYEDRVAVGGEPFNYRLTASYIDQFQVGDGELGIAIGGQLRRDTAPEDSYNTSATFRPCNTIEGVDRSNDCRFTRDGDGNPNGASDTYFVSNQYIYRANAREADRDSILGTIEYAPSPSVTFRFEGQYSFRDDTDERQNLIIADGRRDITPLAISDDGALLRWSGESRVELNPVWRRRTEEFYGLAGYVEWNSGPLTLSGDVSYNQTQRRQDELDMRIRTSSRVFYEIDTVDRLVPNLTFTNVAPVENSTGLTFDLDNHDIYTDAARARRRGENVDDEIFSVRLDGSYEAGGGFFSTIEAGLRYNRRSRVQDDAIDNFNPDNGLFEAELPLVGDFFSPDALAARRDTFLVNDIFVGDSDSNARGLTFANWDPEALFVALTGSRDAGLPVAGVSTLTPDDADVTEETYAAYVQANFDTTLFDLPARGNFGLRVVRTETASVGISSALATSPGGDPGTVLITAVGDPTINIERNGFWTWLPSANLILELADDQLLRFGAYRAIARPDAFALSAGLTFDDTADLDDFGAIVSASGNPFIEPLSSWNADVSYEWYASRTSSLSIAGYAKILQTGFETTVTPLTLTIDGAPQEVLIGRSGNSDESSSLVGFEIAVQHKFDFDVGFQLSYNFADSDFEFEDPTVVGADALADFTDPANIPGFSRHTGNATLFYDNGTFNARIAYRIRSDWFQPFRSDANRFAETQEFVDFSAAYNLTDELQVRFSILNLFDEPNIFRRPVPDSLAQSDFSGTRFFLGLRGRF